MRIGQGFDVHAFTTGRPLVLGGVTVPHHSGLAGHSDADVVIHALIDALLGAAGLGDIGQHFPDTDSRYKNIDSCVMLNNVIEKIQERCFRLGNVDITIIAQSPKLQPFIPDMKATLASVLKVDASAINIKATTTERLGFTGRNEGIAAMSVVLLSEN